MHRPTNLRAPLALALLWIGCAACSGNEPEAAERPAGSPDAATLFLDGVWSDKPLEGAKDVAAIRESGKDGDRVVLRGTLQDFGEMATFRLVEDSLEDCTEMGEEDHCATPWDYCCVEPSLVQRMTVNVEFLDGDLPRDVSLRGQRGLDHLSEVTVAGILRIDEAGNLRLEADRLAMQ